LKKRQLEAMLMKLLPTLPGFAVKGDLLLIKPLGHTLQAVCLEGSSDAQSFYVWVFILPLFVPRKYISFELGRRIRSKVGGECWNAKSPSVISDLSAVLASEALPFLLSIKSPLDVTRIALSFSKTDPYVQQSLAYAFVYSGEFDRAAMELKRLIERLNVQVPWQCEMAQRSVNLLDTLDMGLANAQLRLKSWEAESVLNLGLGEFR
jgi:hypothetical protein